MSQSTPENPLFADAPRIPEAVPGDFTDAMSPLVQAMQARVHELFSAEQLRQEPVAAIVRGVQALQLDWGDAAINFDYQSQLIEWMLVAAEVVPDDEKETAWEALRGGLLRFYDLGGYGGVDVPESARPAMRIARASLAEALVYAARPEDGEVRSLLEELVGRMERDGPAYTPEDIIEFASTHGVPAAELADRMADQDERFIERFQDVMGLATPPQQLAAMVEVLTGDKRAAVQAVRLHAMDDELREAVPWLFGDEYDSGGRPAAGSDDPCVVRPRKTSGSSLKEARTLGKKLRQLSRRGVQNPARIERITEDVLKGIGDERLDQGLLVALLVAYRALVSRPGTTDAVVQSIDRGLQQIAVHRLEPPQIRALWARAAGAMRSQASDKCREIVRSLLETEKDERVRNSLEKAWSGLASADRP